MDLVNAYLAATRFGFGARPGEIAKASEDPKKWLMDQLKDPPTGYFNDLPSTVEIYSELGGGRSQARILLENELKARTTAAILTSSPFYERLVHFWSNHFAVSIKKGWEVSAIAGSYEREAIRPHVTGNFFDMLLAVEQHPAMLFYLDNVRSIGPNSEWRKAKSNRLRRQRSNTGLNENLAREILELHTLGVGGGYKQEDVIELAKIITGWTIDNGNPNNNKNGFIFDASKHEPDAKRLLKKRFSYSDDGEKEGVKALKFLAQHKSTAKFIATKLATHFISDNPSRKTINKIASVFSASRGDLVRTYSAMLSTEEAWNPKNRKIKTPSEFVISAARVTNAIEEDQIKYVLWAMRELGQSPFDVTSPAGWSDNSSDWIGPASLVRRIEWSEHLARSFNKTSMEGRKLVAHVLQPILRRNTFKAIKEAPNKTESLSLLFASPEFQRR